MASPGTIQRNGRADWTLMTTIHAALQMAGDLATTPPEGCGCSCAGTPPVQYRRGKEPG
jgi:hypothetical protein